MKTFTAFITTLAVETGLILLLAMCDVTPIGGGQSLLDGLYVSTVNIFSWLF